MLTPIIREDLLYYLWKTKSFDMTHLKTQHGQKVEVLHFGTQNFDSGPDFSNGKVRIGDTTWVGNIEMHVYSSDWERHCHDIDKAYDNVVLHVVFEHDKEVHTSAELELPCIELKDRIDRNILKQYARLLASKNWVSCEKQIDKVPTHTISFWLQRLVAERIDSKTNTLKTFLDNTNGNWEETFYLFLCRYMGARANIAPFESLARSVPYLLIQKHRDDITRVEALLYGQAGMLNATFEDPYYCTLKKEYSFLSKKYGLKCIDPVAWKFSRMRPVGFPTLRISQLAQILASNNSLVSKIIVEDDTDRLKKIFQVKASEYWNTHYRFGKESIQKEKYLGKDFINRLIINVICPTVFLYGKYIDDNRYCQRAIQHLESIQPENNMITRNFKNIGVGCKSAADSQALLQLKSHYCDHKFCMTCAIGNSILKR